MESSMMNLKFTGSQRINWKNFITGFIWIGLLCLFLGISVFGMVTNESVSRSVADDNRKTDYLTQELPVIQEFVPQHDFITSISFVLNREGGQIAEGVVVFKLFDAAVQLLEEVKISMEDITDGGFTEVVLNRRVKAGETCFYRIEVEEVNGKGPRLEYRSLSGCGPLENRTFYYGSTVMEDSSPVSRITYQVPLEAEQVLTYAAFLVFLGLLLTAGIRKLPDGGQSREINVREAGLRWLGCLLAGVFITYCWDFLIVENRFKTVSLDHAVYGAGLLTVLVLSWYGIWQIRLAPVKKALFSWNAKKAAVVLRTLMFAAVCLWSIYYYNSGSNYGHRIATRGSMICFGVAILTFYPLQKLMHKWSLLYLALTGLGGLAGGFIIPQDGRELYQYVLEVLVAAVWGILVIRLLGNLKEKRMPRLSVWYSVLLFGFFALLVIFRNTRTWPFQIAFYFTVLYLQDFSTKEWRELLRDFCNGILWSFAAVLLFSLLFRPYHRYNYSRYPLAFYSVATCALYLIVVFCAALTKLLAGYRRQPVWRKQIGSLFVMSVVFCYTFMTVSRTAYLALAVAGVCLAVILCLTWYRQKKSTVLVTALFVAGGWIVMMPAVFTATRSIPAIVGNPYIMAAELAHESILPTDTMDSRRYMNVERFLELTFEKLGDTLRYLEFSEEGAVSENALQGRGLSVSGSVEVASNKDFVGLGGINDKAETADNGRSDIFRAYLRELNLTGHESMVVETETETFYHAHNTFLQTAYDHGVLVGIYFVILGVISFFRSVKCFQAKEENEENEYMIFPILIIAAFGVAGLTEWVFHPSIMLGFALLLVQAPLLKRLQ